MTDCERKPYISLYGRSNVLGITRQDINLLGNPNYVCLYNNKKKDSIAIGVCDGRNVMSFKVPINLNGRRDMFKIISKAFVTTIMKCNSLDQAYSYRVEGTYLEGKNMLVFDLNKARKL